MSVRRHQQPKYEVVAKRNGYEIRRYEPYLVAETTVSGSFDETGDTAFRRLAEFISGRNSSSKKLAMTVPVTASPAAGGYTYRFVMERSLDESTVPTPADKRITIRSIPGRLVAARSYRGPRQEERFRREEGAILDALQRDGEELKDDPMFAAYSGPLAPPPLRRNEVLAPIEGRSLS